MSFATLRLHPLLLLFVSLLFSGSLSARAEGTEDPFAQALSHLQQRATTESFATNEAVRAYAERRIQEFKPHKTLSDFVPTEFLELIRATPVEGELLEELYRAYEQEYLNTEGVTAATTERLLLRAMGAQSKATLSEMESTLTLGQRARYRLELPLARGRLTECFNLWRRYLSDPRTPLKRVRVYRFSQQRPSDIRQILLLYRTAGFNVHVSTVSSESMEQDVAEMEQNSNAVLDRLVSNVPSAAQDETRDFLPRMRAAAIAAKDKALLAIGMLKRSELIEYQTQPAAPRGWWTRLKDFGRIFTREFRDVQRSRTALDKVLELMLAGGTVAFTTWAVEQSVQRDMARGEIVNTVLPLVYAALDKLVFVYFQQPVSAFHGQGLDFDFRTNRFDKNAGYLLGSNLLHSVVYRIGLLLATNAAFNPDGGAWMLGPTLAASLFAEGFMSSLRNVYSKGPIQYFLEKLRDHYNRRNMRRKSVIAFGIFNAVWAVVAMGDIFHWTVGEALHAAPFLRDIAANAPQMVSEFSLRDTMVGLSVAGILIELTRKRHSLRDGVLSVWDRIRGIAPSPCETYLSLERVDAH